MCTSRFFEKVATGGSMPSLAYNNAQSDDTSGNDSDPNSAVVSLKPAEELLFYITDETRETQDIITVSNSSEHWMAFKVKTTNPESFRVRPSTGLIRPHETGEIYVYLQPGCSQNVAHEKFLVMLMRVEEDVKLTSLGDRWRNPPTDPEQYFEHRFYCSMKNPNDNSAAGIGRAEEVMAGIKEKMYMDCNPMGDDISGSLVHEIVHSQKRLEEKLYSIYVIQLVLGVALLLVGLYVFLAFVFDFFPFSSTSCTAFSCSYNHWKDFH